MSASVVFQGTNCVVAQEIGSHQLYYAVTSVIRTVKCESKP